MSLFYLQYIYIYISNRIKGAMFAGNGNLQYIHIYIYIYTCVGLSLLTMYIFTFVKYLCDRFVLCVQYGQCTGITSHYFTSVFVV